MMKREETDMQLIFAEMKATDRTEIAIIHMKRIINSIQPYSRWWRWGYIRSLRLAIKALEKMKEDTDSSGLKPSE